MHTAGVSMTNEHVNSTLDGSHYKRTQSFQHRAIYRLKLTPVVLLQLVFLPIFFCSLLFWIKPYLFLFWRQCIYFWSVFLNFPLSIPSNGLGLTDSTQLGLVWMGGSMNGYMPTSLQLGVTSIMTGLAFLVTFKMRGAMLPIKYAIRILATVMLVSIAYFFVVPTQFPYSIMSHMHDIANLGFVLLVSSPVMLALGYYVFPFSLTTKIKHTALILLYFTILIPHQIVLHILVLQHLSLLFMPILYICFGTLFDVLIFVALYSWAASTIPQNATL
jgi:hypothetical protein